MISMAMQQEPKLEVPTIYKDYKAYVTEYPNKIWHYMVQYIHFRILKIGFMGMNHFNTNACSVVAYILMGKNHWSSTCSMA